MVYLGVNKDVSINELIRILQKARKDTGGDTRVVISHEDSILDMGVISSDYVDEDEDRGDESF